MRRIIAIAIASLTLVIAAPVWPASQTPLTASAATLVELRSLGELRARFNSDRGKVRIILLVSPT
jgi:hypothetical protein